MSPSFLLTLACVLPCVLALSYIFTRWMIHNAEALDLIAVPNHRSSHKAPTPSGGGVVFTLTFFIGLAVMYLLGWLDRSWVLPLFIGGPLVSIVGFLDDRRSLPAVVRLTVHMVAAVVTYMMISNMFTRPMEISFLPTSNQTLLGAFCILYIAWMINLYNFMDGIDGLAATQAVVVAIFSAALSFWQGGLQLGAIYLLLASSVAGFLILNWSPAKIFMGDCGAYLLGFAFAALALITKVYAGQSFHAHMILLGVFIADATCTLLSRLVQGKKVYHAHRDHAFQHAVQRGLSHRRVSLMWNAVTAFWLGPMAAASVIYADQGLLFLCLSYAPLLVLMIYMKAGIEVRAPLESETEGEFLKKDKPIGPWV